jgi:hypothetical protein
MTVQADAAPWRQALVLSLGAVVSLGLARFAYALLLPPMRADLGWSYFVAGAMNTANAAGYLAGALALLRLGSGVASAATFVGGGVLAARLASQAAGQAAARAGFERRALARGLAG